MEGEENLYNMIEESARVVKCIYDRDWKGTTSSTVGTFSFVWGEGG